MGMKNARKCNNDVRTYTPRSSTTGRRDTKANRALLQDRFRAVAPAWLGKRISAEVRRQDGSIFHHFPIPSTLTCDKCRQLSVLGFTRGSLGSSQSKRTVFQPRLLGSAAESIFFPFMLRNFDQASAGSIRQDSSDSASPVARSVFV